MAHGFRGTPPPPIPSTWCSTRHLVTSCPLLQGRTRSPYLAAFLQFEAELQPGSTDHWCDSGRVKTVYLRLVQADPSHNSPLKPGETDLEEVKECLQSCRARRWRGRGSSPGPLYPKHTLWSPSKTGPQSLQAEHANNHAASWSLRKAHGAWGGICTEWAAGRRSYLWRDTGCQAQPESISVCHS